MDFYKEQRNAFRDIIPLFDEGLSDDAIVYKITLKYCISEKAIRKRLELMRRLNNGKTKNNG